MLHMPFTHILLYLFVGEYFPIKVTKITRGPMDMSAEINSHSKNSGHPNTNVFCKLN